MSVAAVQRQLQISKNLERIEMAPYLSRLCEALAASMIAEGRPVTLKVKAQDGTTSSNEAVSIGLIVTELAINALRHAFVDGRSGGMIAVGYEAAPSGWRLEVSDDGLACPTRSVRVWGPASSRLSPGSSTLL